MPIKASRLVTTFGSTLLAFGATGPSPLHAQTPMFEKNRARFAPGSSQVTPAQIAAQRAKPQAPHPPPSR